MVDILLKRLYGLNVLRIEKSTVGAGSDTYFADCAEGNFVVKFPSVSEMNDPETEPKLCEFLLEKGINVCEFIKNKDGNYLSSDDCGRVFHVQKFFEGRVYELNSAPECADGVINAENLAKYFKAYLRFSSLTEYDLKSAAELFYYQISVCDYYGQYYSSAADNREIYLNQAVFSTRLMKWFETHIGEINEILLSI